MANATQNVYISGRWFTISGADEYVLKQLNHGKYKAALEACDLILRKVPKHAIAYHHRGLAFHRMGQTDNSLESLQKATQLDPEFAAAWCSLAGALAGAEQFEEALRSFERGLVLNPVNAQGHYNKAITLVQLRRCKEAIAAFDQAVRLNPTFIEAYYYCGITHIMMGEMSAAKEAFLKILAINPDHTEAHVALCNIQRDHGQSEIARLRHLLTQPQLHDQEKAALFFSLGKIYDDSEKYDEAFECYKQANQLFGSSIPYNAAEEDKVTSEIIEVFNEDFLKSPFDFASNDETPVFVVGMNRSGTTLIATMLSNHPLIQSAGELDKLNKLALDLPESTGSNLSYPKAVEFITKNIGERFIRDYLTRLRRDACSQTRYVIDKLPINFRHIGLITKLFPRAHIIHCIRHPLDTGLSNYCQRFSPQCNFSFDLRNFGHYYLEYRRLMDHWRKFLPHKMMEVRYEDMVLKTDEVARNCLERMGLEYDEYCTNPHLNTGIIETSSYWQARQPIYKSSLNRWRNYEKHIAPLRDMLPPDML